MSPTAQQIETLLREKLAPTKMELQDESVQHSGHAGAATGGGHYSLLVVSGEFRGKNTVERHRLIYACLGDLMQQEIHALAMKTYTPEEWQKAGD